MTKAYDGYTTGGEDKEFYTVMHNESNDLLSEFTTTSKLFADMQTEVEKLIESVV